MKKKFVLISVVLLIIALVIFITVNKFFFIKSVSIEYVPGYNLAIGDMEDPFIDFVTINLNKKQAKEMTNYLDKMKGTSNITDCDCLNEELYRLIINGEDSYTIGSDWITFKRGNKEKNYTVPEGLIEYISILVEENNEKIFNKISSQEVSLEAKGVNVSLSDEQKIKIMKNFSYLNINIDENVESYDGGYKYIIKFDNDYILYIYNSKVGYLFDNKHNKGSYVVLRNDNLWDYLNEISIVGNDLTSGEMNDIKYKIYKDNIFNDYDFSKKGYYYQTYNTPEAPHIYLISMGLMNTGGYDIDVVTVDINKDGKVNVVIKETIPSPGDSVTDAFTNPIVIVEFDKPVYIESIKNTNGENYLYQDMSRKKMFE